MIVLFEKMAMLVILLALGYLCARMKLVGPEFNKGLSKLVIDRKSTRLNSSHTS